MKIAVAASGQTPESQVDLRFGRCPFYLIFDSETKKYTVLKNTATQAFRGAGLSAAQLIADQGAKVIITGNLGPKAQQVLAQSGIKIISGVFGKTAKEAVFQVLSEPKNESKK